MFDPTRIGRAIGLTVGAAAALAGVGAVAALRRPLPRVSGRAPLPGLEANATVLRDRWGVPHIYARSDSDLFAALGYVHAQDRLWQMELNRRTGHGQLAEILGPIALSSDIFVRTLGFSRVARREVELLDDEVRTIVEAYCRGVNACVAASRGRLPLEFSILGFQPRPWEPADILVWPKVMGLNLSGNWMSELLNARIVAALGPERAAALAPRYPDDGPPTVPAGTVYPIDIGAEALRLASEAAPFTGQSGTAQGSNAWVVSGARSASGKPLLADDPHLGLGLPGIWYEAHLVGGSFEVTGVTMPGTCGVIIGHNARIAWGVTNAMTDNQDLYLERFHPDDPLRYAFRGEWLRAELVREEIAIKGQREPTAIEVRVTRHGPVIDDAAGAIHARAGQGNGLAHTSLALRWTALDPNPSLSRAVLRLNRARDYDEFRAALTDWDCPPQNFVYADVDGHIAYTLAGRLPIRARGDGQLPVPGWDGEYEWIGFIPPAALPASLDPPSGAAVTANNRIAAADYPFHHALHGEWLNPYRSQRISELLDASPTHDQRSFARIQLDLRSLPGLALAAAVADLEPAEPLERRARDLLVAWDGELGPDSVAGTIYDALRHHLLREAYAELGDMLALSAGLGAFGALPGNSYLDRALPTVLARIASAPRPGRLDPWLGVGRGWDELLGLALSRAVAELRQRFGSDPARWTYGRVHSLTLRHPLGSVAALAPIFNRGPWPTGGDLDTVNQHYVPRDTAAGPLYNAPSYRQIVDLSDWDASRVILPAGQSGHPASRHYSDMAEAWRSGGYHPMLWSRASVERHTVSTLTFEPRPNTTEPGANGS